MRKKDRLTELSMQIDGQIDIQTDKSTFRQMN